MTSARQLSFPPLMAALVLFIGCARESLPAYYPPFAAPAPPLVPAGGACLEQLRSRGIQYRQLEAKRGMHTPVEITGPIGGVRFTLAGRTSLTCDCRLALALARISTHLEQLGISEVQHSGAYVYRRTRSGRLSLHARGLAVDVHRVHTAAELLRVSRDFERGLTQPCLADSPTLNQLACRLHQTRLFRELLTPDNDADHHDHFHLGLAPQRG